ncbi:hypothetical protein BC936DRAFT_147254 [Jimgerdemannia flammicorona]|uniref:F-box domain-containing protein n=1 Tax=Jimgerdemannia flammicorona TaxID=994334 RepID=A0A433DLK8_9FUNG|nr:hypothetical protein BC936DRAFT_147254 [Jimgerdemannia flammicorona]
MCATPVHGNMSVVDLAFVIQHSFSWKVASFQCTETGFTNFGLWVTRVCLMPESLTEMSLLYRCQITSKPTRRIHLPIEILHQIFQYLEPEECRDLPLDRLACSLVCRAWSSVARSFFNERSFNPLWCQDHFQVTQLARLVWLLKEAERMGLDFSDLEFGEINIHEGVFQIERSYDIAFDEFSASTLVKLFSQCSINFSNLNIVTNNILQRKKSNFYKRIQPFCSNLHALYIYDYRGGLITHGSSFIRRLNKNIRLIRRFPITIESSTTTISVTYRHATHTSFTEMLLEQCKRLTYRFCALHPISLLGRNRLSYFDTSMQALMFSSSDLEALEFRSKIISSWAYVSSLTLSRLVQRSRYLEHLTITHCSGADDAFLTVLAQSAANLKSLELIACTDITGKNVAYMDEKEYRMTELCVLNLKECDGLYPQFVGRVVASCEKLEELQLPQHLTNNDRLEEVLRLYGFCRKRGGAKWLRKGDF